MAVKYKKKCVRCKKNYVIATTRSGYIECYECQKPNLEGEITDPKMKKLFDIPDKYLIDNWFIRTIKINCIRYGKLSEKQIEAVKKAIQKMKDEEDLRSVEK